jgi:hypothetical protein
VTEAEWLAGVDPEPLLEHWRKSATERQLRLFALACCARIDHLITDPRSRAALDFAERNVEASLTRRRGRKSILKAAHVAWKEAYAKIFARPPGMRPLGLIASCAADAAEAPLNTEPWLAARYAASAAAFAVGWGAMVAAGVDSAADLDRSLTRAEQEQQARLLRDIAGNPFRPITVEPGLRAARSGVRKLAEALYEERRLAELPILGDALEDAGCTDEVLLSHCRRAGPHVRGCWVLDALLTKT